jgi:glycosyltransferase involved in cell wall biosynthesis
MNVSVIIPTYNEENVILVCLASLGEQSYDDFEIIVVDDGSDDKTVSRLESYGLRVTGLMKRTRNAKRATPKPIKLLIQNHKGPGVARNLGAIKAKGEILVFVDADMTFEPDFISNLVKPIVDGKAKGTFSMEEYVSNWDNIWSWCWNINQNWPERKRHPNNYPDEEKVFRAILKKEFDKVGGFTPGGYTDDYSLYDKLGYKSNAAPGARFYHKNPSSLSEVFRQARWSGKRQYKFGAIGNLFALVRVSLPVSLIIGLYKSIINFKFEFLIFKLIYDFGIFIGILSYIFTGRGSK